MKGIVYKIVGGDEVYVGSTTRSLKERIKTHKSNDNKTASRILFDKYEFENCIFEIIEEVDFEDIEDLLLREEKWRLLLNSVNKKRAIHFTLRYEGRKAYAKEYYIQNKETYQLNAKRWSNNNKERRQETYKKWYEGNKEVRKIKSAERYKQNKDKTTTDIKCECGVVYKKNNKSHHINKNKQHKKWVEDGKRVSSTS